MSENTKKQSNPLLGKSLLICALLAIGFVLTDACFFADGFKAAFAAGKYADLANYCFYLIGFTSVVLYGLFFYKKSPAFFRGLLIFSVAFFTLIIGTRISLLSYSVEYTGMANAARIVKIIQVGGLFVFAIIAFLIGLVASRLSKKERNRALLNACAIIAWVFGVISALVNLFVVNKISAMGLPEVCAALSDLVPAIFMTTVAMAFVLGSQARHSDDPIFIEE